jgi:hypothetical protein
MPIKAGTLQNILAEVAQKRSITIEFVADLL